MDDTTTESVALETAKSLLKQIEWRRGPFGNQCQFCEGINPEHTLFVKDARGHREGCPYAAFLMQYEKERSE